MFSCIVLNTGRWTQKRLGGLCCVDPHHSPAYEDFVASLCQHGIHFDDCGTCTCMNPEEYHQLCDPMCQHHLTLKDRDACFDPLECELLYLELIDVLCPHHVMIYGL